MATTKFNFQNSSGEKLAARVELPLNQHPKSWALFAHCFTCNKNLTAVRNISRALTQHGFGVVRFDFTGLGESEGDFSDTNFSSNIQDLITAAEAMADEFGAPELLVGHSLGGAAVFFAGKAIESVQAIATIGAPSSPDHVKHLFESWVDEIVEEEHAEVKIEGRPFTVKKQFLEDIESKNMATCLNTLRKPLLLLHSPQDDTVGIANAGEIYSHAMHPKSFISLDGADHLLSKKEDSQYAGNVIAGWAQRYIDPTQDDKPLGRAQAVAQIGIDKFTTDIQMGKHAIRADEPIEMGGNDFGPSPYDLLLASLGACTSMTMKMYAERKGWAIDEITVHLDHDKDYVKDCEECEQPSSKIDIITRKIEIKADLDDSQLARLRDIADKCPVHRTLHSDVSVNTELNKVG